MKKFRGPVHIYASITIEADSMEEADEIGRNLSAQEVLDLIGKERGGWDGVDLEVFDDEFPDEVSR